MKKSFLIVFSVFCSKLCFCQPAKHIILISIDGLHPDMYLDKGWPAPNVQALMKQGTYADHMLSVFPSYTYPSHTAMVTGAVPARSGIYYNQPVGTKGEWNWFSDKIKVSTLWQVLEKAGLTTAAVEWPVSVTKDITWNIPEIWSEEHQDRITESKKYATPGLVTEIEEHATGKLDSVNMSEDNYSMDANSGRMAAYIFQTKRPALLAVHLAEVDGYEHEYGRDADSVRIALGQVDAIIGQLVQTVRNSDMRDSTVILIVGDHGFSTYHTVFRPNMLIKGLPAKFIAAGGSAFLYRSATAKKENDAQTLKLVIKQLDALPKEKRKLFRIIERKELDKLGADSSAILALAAVPGIVFSGSTEPAKTTNQGPGTNIQNSLSDGVFIQAFGGHHGYDPNIPEMYTGFIAWGAGIYKGGHIKELCVTDIAPLISKLLKIDFKTPDGHLVPGILKPIK
ncbi:MAG TPA: ectonucleotide pyrophosphatase/phosphodiesterase [Mucilaginibacter sp.]|jgi:predicted AlkP superfamily pyrophosphatase or phosphodiesterase